MFGLISLQHLANIIPFLLIIYKNILSRGKNIVPLHTDYVQINALICTEKHFWPNATQRQVKLIIY